MKIPTLIILLFIFINNCQAQTYLEPVIGFQAGAGNGRLRQLNTAVQYSSALDKGYELVWQVQRSWPLGAGYNDSAFTPNTTLPVYQNARRTVRPATLSAAIGHRFRIVDASPADRINFLLFTGVKYEKIKVGYAYDKTNYTVLYPDVTRSKFGAYFSLGVEYLHTFKTGRVFSQIAFAIPPVGKKTRNQPGQDFIAPLTLNIGYSIMIKQGKHGKK